MTLLTPNDIKCRLFTTRGWVHKGYDAGEVDDFLDDAADTVHRLCLRALQSDSRVNAYRSDHRRRRRALKRKRSINRKGFRK